MTRIASRRELNKARTREAIISALRGLAERQALSTITVDQVAEAADVSRRTFFNYYAGIPAVLTEVFSGLSTQLVTQIDQDLVLTDPVAALRRLVRAEALSEELLRWCAVLNQHDASPCHDQIERSVWADLATWLQDVLTDLLPEATDPLYIATLSAAVMNAFAAAEQAWLAETKRPIRLTPADIKSFHQHLDRSLGYLSGGLRVPH